MKNITTRCICTFAFSIVIFFGCDDFVQVDPPRTALVKSTVFESDATANAAMLDVYYQLRTSAFASGSLYSISYLMSLTSDEQLSYYVGSPSTVIEYQQFNENVLTANNTMVSTLWSDLYTCIYKSNAILEGIELSSSLSENMKNQLEGEARFMRAFCHFYLVNLWGDVPLVTTTDYRANSKVGRTSKNEVYSKITEDLLVAQEKLNDNYASSNNERVRVNKGAATSMLARTYLYSKDWANAELHASAVLGNTSLYALSVNLINVFNLNNTEAIFQLWSTLRPNERTVFRFLTTPSFGAIRSEFISGFESGDLRRSTWTNTSTSGLISTSKYSAAAINPPTQYSTILRVAEQYLIRAEARTRQNNIPGAQSDINVIRTRAGLVNTTANDTPSLLAAIERERRSEFFNEWGHRWFDLNRTNRADAILSPLKSGWTQTAMLLPIPESEIKNNSALQNAQNPGY